MNATDSLEFLTLAASIIERDAIMAMLQENGIVSESPARDISRKVTDTTVDLSYEGYSAFFDGFKIFVKASDLERSKTLLSEFIKSAAPVPVSQDYVYRFYLSSISTLILPVIFHFVAVYSLYKAIRLNQKFSPFKLVFSLLILIGSAWIFFPFLSQLI